MDIHQFFLGNAFDAYTFFGAHVQKDGSAPLPPMQKRYR